MADVGGDHGVCRKRRPRRHARRGGARALGPGAVVLSVLVVHGVHLQKPLFYDDYDWYGAPDHSGWVSDALSPSLTIYRPLVAFWFAGVRGVFGFSPVAYHVFATRVPRLRRR